jgi:hypothetical protein
MGKFWLVLIVLAAIGAVAYYSGFIDSFVEAFDSSFHGHAGLPSCDSLHGKADATKAIDNAPFAKANNLNIIALTNPKTITVSAVKVQCQATAILNVGKQVVIDYSFAKDASFSEGQYYVQSSLEIETARPYP